MPAFKEKLRYGWKRDLPDHRDHFFAAPPKVLASLPSSFDLRTSPAMPPVYNQGEEGSCGPNASCGAEQFDRRKQGFAPDFTPSRSFQYYNVRKLEGTIPYDAGSTIRDCIKALATFGVCPAVQWPYVDTPADPATGAFPAGSQPVTEPSAACYQAALAHKAIKYARVQQALSQIKGCIASGFPVVFGFTVYSSMFDANGNPVTTLPMPSMLDQVEGGHAVCAVAYDNATQLVAIRNSWGPDVQDQGYFYMPYAYILNPELASDFWMLTAVQG